jgi:hypothetical protein
MRCEIFTVVKIEIMVSWGLTPYSLVDRFRVIHGLKNSNL